MQLDEMVAKYIELRDRKALLKAKYDADVEKIDEMLAACERFFLATMNEQKLEALPTAAGVPYKQKQTSAGIADWNLTLPWIIKNEMWHMLERRVSKSAVEEYRAANDDLPPGVNWAERTVVNVRRK